MNRLDRIARLEAANAERTRYKLTQADGNSIIMRDLGDCIRRCFREPNAPKVIRFEPLHAGPFCVLERLIPSMLKDIL